MNILNILKLPYVKENKLLDHPKTTLLHAKIIQAKPYLKNIYTEFYSKLRKASPKKKKTMLFVELGSGGGFIKEVIPYVKTSDIVKLPTLDMQFSVLSMPFEKESIDAFFMIDVFHHIPNMSVFFREVDRTLKKKGKLIMIEPANTLWGRFLYSHFHHEPFDPKGGWLLKNKGRLSGANSALPWIIFVRDRRKFENLFPRLKIVRIEPHTPLSYIISGGLTFRQLLPSSTYGIVRFIERVISPLNRYLGIFYTIELIKEENKRQ